LKAQGMQEVLKETVLVNELNAMKAGNYKIIPNSWLAAWRRSQLMNYIGLKIRDWIGNTYKLNDEKDMLDF
jgi:hypothetical protein